MPAMIREADPTMHPTTLASPLCLAPLLFLIFQAGFSTPCHVDSEHKLFHLVPLTLQMLSHRCLFLSERFRGRGCLLGKAAFHSVQVKLSDDVPPKHLTHTSWETLSHHDYQKRW